ncbi:TetR/AcrR family transcriptional regulator [Lewinella sp. IMCC34183]|uniref:TetR/AcrR family transcriptional regulator n=1 Tax=Lewinella sp. IMCC34183 TaxID=2248762 RepID=UPI000E259CA8|nr:TetR/AcrR family transcriptional regulator [Lewinella sp. IMCC34183]
MPDDHSLPSISNLSVSTEEKIRLAALRVFMQKGYDGTRTRDIAEVAGINVATLHYYHRKKEQLFELVAREAMRDFTGMYREVFTHDLPLEEKIRAFVNRSMDLFSEQPDLAMFCLAESERNPAAFRRIVDFREGYEVVAADLRALSAKQKIRPISAPVFINALVGMTIYPFLTRNTIQQTASVRGTEFQEMLAEQRRVVPEMIIAYLFGHPAGPAAIPSEK